MQFANLCRNHEDAVRVSFVPPPSALIARNRESFPAFKQEKEEGARAGERAILVSRFMLCRHLHTTCNTDSLKSSAARGGGAIRRRWHWAN